MHSSQRTDRAVLLILAALLLGASSMAGCSSPDVSSESQWVDLEGESHEGHEMGPGETSIYYEDSLLVLHGDSLADTGWTLVDSVSTVDSASGLQVIQERTFSKPIPNGTVTKYWCVDCQKYISIRSSGDHIEVK